VWNEALNLVGVEVSSALRRAENVYYPPAIQAPGSSASQDDATPNVISPIKEVLTKDPSQQSSKKDRANQRT